MWLLRYYRRAFSIFVHEPAFRALGLAALTVLMSGTVFYHFSEGWSWIDSLYFSTVTLATIGYGDFTPTSEFTRVVTLIYILRGLGVMATFFSVLVRAPLLADGKIPSTGPAGMASPSLQQADAFLTGFSKRAPSRRSRAAAKESRQRRRARLRRVVQRPRG